MKDVVWGIIGCGNVTEVKSGPAFNLAENSSLLAVMRRDKTKAKDYAERHNVPEYHDTADSIINHPEINAVYIATPPSTHLHYALQVLAVNKNVYIEKPMTLNSDEAILLSEALKKSTSKLTVAHYRRRLPMFLEVKRIIDENALGDINSVEVKMFQSRKAAFIADSESNWRINPVISGGGYFNDLAPHQLDLLLYWFGEVKDFSGNSSAEGSQPNVATKISGVLNFENGISCIGNWNFIADETEQKDECSISGTKGSIRFPFFGNEIVLESDGKKEILKYEHPKHIQQPIIQSTVNYFLEKGENPCPIEEGIKGMQIIDAFIK
ncbi:Gfo/Idh/MocA family oxidoreductase [uncultured Winogradskyella sp.]|uniref:Gfo/Idh/MocA family protein n=1 Tax=uncultured Winogradskyella sp. TaxID=395353 RepID=UPI0026341B60|nr:Gfo/Idh/MocA family oxidoreductase [uncultured Winogradskyella sp.]